MEDSRTQRPYRYGMILLCLGAIINWLGLSETSQNGEPIRYLGVACILGKYLHSIKTSANTSLTQITFFRRWCFINLYSHVLLASYTKQNK